MAYSASESSRGSHYRKTFPPKAEKSMSPLDPDLYVSLHAIQLTLKGVDQLLSKVADCRCGGYSPPIKDTPAASPPNKPQGKAAIKLPLKIPLLWCQCLGRPRHRSWNKLALAKPKCQPVCLSLISHSWACKSPPSYRAPREGHGRCLCERTNKGSFAKSPALEDNPSSNAVASLERPHNH